MNLNFRKYGEGPALIILHGLYGSSDNWVGIARELADHFEVFVPDQRNHGASPHTKEHSYDLLKNDLLEFMEQHSIEKATLLGHSMGGKTAMYFAKDYPLKIDHLIVVDISPRSYKSPDQPAPHTVDHMNIIMAMRQVDFSSVENRMDVDMILAETIKSQRVRQFLLKNIKRKDQDTLCWKLNLETLQRSLPEIMDGLDPATVNKGRGINGFPVLFFKGENSDYISDPDLPVIQKIFPAAEIVTIPNTGHWLHAEQTELFLKNLRYFLAI
ncbi:MAG: alpha/beta fold hydrolase [Bacteroidales bacterium]|nr:alpha/beta fold hydrolase [Bacteroidales bacterium]